jgi:3'5'-cyclic nucleotide phosphodiesterase
LFSSFRFNSSAAFHNFQHAVHVSQSVSKLLSRIVAPDLDQVGQKSLHDHTYGITSDPLTRFSVVIAALIHDLDHPGVPNAVLVKEDAPVAKLYKGRSVAEQNSVDIFFDLLMEPQFKTLRRQIYTNEDEFCRFHQLIVNTVMATDIVDKDLKTLRNNRWETAFNAKLNDDSAVQAANRKATIGMSSLNFLQCSELQIISPSHTTISFFILPLRSHRALDSGVRCGAHHATFHGVQEVE